MIEIDGVDVSGCKYRYQLLRSNEYGCNAESERKVKITLCKNCPNCYFKKLKRAEQKLKKIKVKEYLNSCNLKAAFTACDILQTIEGEEFSPLQKMYLELEKIITPRLLEDFCGYNEETQSFDIILATKEIIEDKEQECEKLKFTIKHTGLLGLMNKNVELKQALDKIEKIARENDIYKSDFGNCGYRNITSNILDIIHKGKE